MISFCQGLQLPSQLPTENQEQETLTVLGGRAG